MVSFMYIFIWTHCQSPSHCLGWFMKLLSSPRCSATTSLQHYSGLLCGVHHTPPCYKSFIHTTVSLIFIIILTWVRSILRKSEKINRLKGDCLGGEMLSRVCMANPETCPESVSWDIAMHCRNNASSRRDRIRAEHFPTVICNLQIEIIGIKVITWSFM